jgi:hypothetical protein
MVCPGVHVGLSWLHLAPYFLEFPLDARVGLIKDSFFFVETMCSRFLQLALLMDAVVIMCTQNTWPCESDVGKHSFETYMAHS